MPGAKGNMLRELRAKTPAAGSVKTQVLAGAALICGFIGVVAWFDGVDFYHRHFFDTGPIVAADNLVRDSLCRHFFVADLRPGRGHRSPQRCPRTSAPR